MSAAKKIPVIPESSDAAHTQEHDPHKGTQDRIAVLRSVSLFEDVKSTPGAIEALAAIMSMRTFATGVAILREGERGHELFVLLEGNVSVIKKTPAGEEFSVARLTGALNVFFGEGAILDEDVRSATIVAQSPCVCLALSREDFINYAQQHPTWALPVVMRIVRVVMGRLKKVNADMMLLYHALMREVSGHLD